MVFCFDRKNYGFTILELLVVMLCFAIVALMIPAAISQQSEAVSEDSSDYIKAQNIKMALTKSDLRKAQAQLTTYKSKTGQFPATNRCDKAETTQNICLIAYQGTIYNYRFDVAGGTYSLSGIRLDLDYLFEVSSDDSNPRPKKIVTANSISITNGSTCAIMSKNDLRCSGKYWHYDSNKIGSLKSELSLEKIDVSLFDSKNLLSISNNLDHSCAIFGGSKVFCWGLNDRGQLGNGAELSAGISSAPVQITTPGLTEINSNSQNSCAVDNTGVGYCWGENSFGQIGNGSNQDTSKPTVVAVDGVKFVSIKTATHSCGLTTDYKLYCWGRNNYGQLGNGNLLDQNKPVLVSNRGLLNGKKIIKFAVADDHTCVLSNEANIYCWGRNNYGQLGNGSYIDQRSPSNSVSINKISGTFKDLSIANGVSCGLTGKSRIFCWGNNDKFQIGSTNVDKSSSPIEIYGEAYLKNRTLSTISVAEDHVCTLDTKGYIFCWGDNSFGQLGDGTNISSDKPLFVMPGTL